MKEINCLICNDTKKIECGDCFDGFEDIDEDEQDNDIEPEQDYCMRCKGTQEIDCTYCSIEGE